MSTKFMQGGGKPFVKHGKLMLVSLHANAPTVHAAGNLSRRATFALVFGIFGVLHADFHYKTIMGNIGIVT